MITLPLLQLRLPSSMLLAILVSIYRYMTWCHHMSREATIKLCASLIKCYYNSKIKPCAECLGLIVHGTLYLTLYFIVFETFADTDCISCI